MAAWKVIAMLFRKKWVPCPGCNGRGVISGDQIPSSRKRVCVKCCGTRRVRAGSLRKKEK